MQSTSFSRRSFMSYGLAAGASLIAGPAWAAISQQPLRTIALANTHTGEKLRTVYWARGSYLRDGLAEINHVLRDHRTGDVHALHTDLIDLLYALRAMTETEQAFEVISGYRSPKTNAMLAKQSNGVAKKSLHMRGMAIDIRLPGVGLDRLRDAAKSLEAGGVGYYARSNFIHVDIGRVRYW